MGSSAIRIVRRMYAAINDRDLDAVAEAFAPNAIWHGAGTQVHGNETIAEMVGELIEASGHTLSIELHDVLASDEHVVALQITRAERDDQRLEDRVVYVFHIDDRRITEAWFNGDPSVQDAFWT